MSAMRFVLPAILLVLTISAACRVDDSDKLNAVDRQTEIGQVLEVAEGSKVTVSGYLVADRDGNTRLCSGLLEFDPNSVPDTFTAKKSSVIRTGIKGVGGLTEVRLSIEN